MTSINQIGNSGCVSKVLGSFNAKEKSNELEYSFEAQIETQNKTEEVNIKEEDLETIYLEINNEIEAKKVEIKEKQSQRNGFGNFLNGTKEFFGFGDKKELEKIEQLQNKLTVLQNDPQGILEVWEEVFDQKLTKEEYLEIIDSKNFISSLDSNTKNLIKESLKEQVLSINEYLNNTKNENGLIADTWDGFKNLTRIGAGSKKAQNDINNILAQIDNSKEKDIAKLYKNLTGKNLTQEELQKYIQGDSSIYESECIKSVIDYSNGQKACVDTIAEIGSGIAAFSCYSAALGGAIAAPFTGGASLTLTAAAIGSASLAGGAAKTGIKALEAKSGGQKYDFNQGLKDFKQGAINGPLAALSAGISVGVSKLGAKFGIKAAQKALEGAKNQIVVGFSKSVSKDAAKTVFDQGIKNGVIGIGEDAIENIAKKESMRYAFIEANNQAIKAVAVDTFGKLPNQAAINQISKAILSNAAQTTALLEGAAVSKSAMLAQNITFNTVNNAITGAGVGAISSSANYLSEVDKKDYNLADFTNTITKATLIGGISAAGAGLLNQGTSALKGKEGNIGIEGKGSEGELAIIKKSDYPIESNSGLIESIPAVSSGIADEKLEFFDFSFPKENEPFEDNNFLDEYDDLFNNESYCEGDSTISCEQAPIDIINDSFQTTKQIDLKDYNFSDSEIELLLKHTTPEFVVENLEFGLSNESIIASIEQIEKEQIETWGRALEEGAQEFSSLDEFLDEDHSEDMMDWSKKIRDKKELTSIEKENIRQVDEAFTKLKKTDKDMIQYRGEVIKPDTSWCKQILEAKIGDEIQMEGYTWTTDSKKYAFDTYAQKGIAFQNRWSFKYNILCPKGSSISLARSRLGQEFILARDSSFKVVQKEINKEDKTAQIYLELIP